MRAGDLQLIRPDDERAIGDGRVAGTIDDEGEQAAGGGLSDDRQVGDYDQRVGAEIFVGGFHKVQALVIHGYGNCLRLPALGMCHVLPPDGYYLLRIEQRQAGTERPFWDRDECHPHDPPVRRCEDTPVEEPASRSVADHTQCEQPHRGSHQGHSYTASDDW